MRYHVIGVNIDAKLPDLDSAEAYLFALGYSADPVAPLQYMRRWEVSPRMFARTWAEIKVIHA
jgi:hypothetical protein